MLFSLLMLSVSAARWARLGPTQGRGPLTSKRAPHLKKGYGATGLGSHTKKGFFHINTQLVPKFVVPDLTGFELKPYVSRKTPVMRTVREYMEASSVDPRTRK
jgi:large subunit ribosomal protein L41